MIEDAVSRVRIYMPTSKGMPVKRSWLHNCYNQWLLGIQVCLTFSNFIYSYTTNGTERTLLKIEAIKCTIIRSHCIWHKCNWTGVMTETSISQCLNCVLCMYHQNNIIFLFGHIRYIHTSSWLAYHNLPSYPFADMYAMTRAAMLGMHRCPGVSLRACTCMYCALSSKLVTIANWRHWLISAGGNCIHVIAYSNGTVGWRWSQHCQKRTEEHAQLKLGL